MNIFKYLYILDMSILSDEQKLNKKLLRLKIDIYDIDSDISKKNNETILKLNKYSNFENYSIEEMEKYYITKIINPIEIKIKKLYTEYKTFSDDIIYNNIEINVLLCNLLYKYCFFIYANNTYIKNIIEFKEENDGKKFDDFLLEKINKTINPPSKINKSLLYYSYLLYLFNIDILDERYDYKNIKIIDYISIEKHKLDNVYINDEKNFENITIITLNDYENDDDIHDYFIIVDYIKFIILIIKDLYKTPKQHYITLPQYEGICWFISMITSISYSDGSKNLLIEKDFHTKVDNDFSKYIYYIIDNITRKYKIYNKDNYLTDCDLFKTLKTAPLILLKKIILDLFKSISHEMIKDYLSKIVMQYVSTSIEQILDKIKNNFNSGMIYSNINYGLDSVIYTVVVDILSNKSEIKMLNSSSIPNSKRQKTSEISHDITSKDNNIIGLKLIEYIYNQKLLPILTNDNENNVFMTTNLNIIGLISTNNNIISYFYNLLGISNKFFHKYENDDEETIIIDKNSETVIEDPDIIIIYKFNNYKEDDQKYINLIGSNFDETIDDDINNINYNKKKYKLDYIIHASNDKYTCINCAHCICGIHYENEEYYYDSSYDVDKLTCHGETVYLPCPLLKSTWSDKINRDNYCYKLEQCAHIEWKEKNFNPIEQNSSTNNICYSKSTNIILVYIKVKEISGGKQEKISLIHNSIKYNRTIYLKQNKKYILFKNKYFLLSKLKYNNKLNLYYI